MTADILREQLERGALDARLKEIYLTEDPAEERARVKKVLDMYEARFVKEPAGFVPGQSAASGGAVSGGAVSCSAVSCSAVPGGAVSGSAVSDGVVPGGAVSGGAVSCSAASGGEKIELYSAPGRTELGGNHTDHQRGCVLAASVSLDLMAAAAPNGTGTVVLESEGYDLLHVDISDDTVHPEEINQTAALIRGIAAAIRQRGYQPEGFNACVISDVPGGSGLSSSAAFETLIGVIFNHMYCGDALDSVEIAKIGKYAENVYFGKPCGLMDQMACSVGGAVAIDFEEQDNPKITRIPFSFADSGYQLCIIDSGADHADLTEDYAAVPAEMKSVAQYFGKEVLREVPEAQYRKKIPALREVCGDRAVLRASHFYRENDRVKAETEALLAGDFQTYLKTAEASGRSSFMYLQNVYSSRFPEQQAVAVALMTAEYLLDGKGACRVHGGGFAGTIQAFVPDEDVEAFRQSIDAVLGEGSCRVLQIRPLGGIVIV